MGQETAYTQENIPILEKVWTPSFCPHSKKKKNIYNVAFKDIRKVRVEVVFKNDKAYSLLHQNLLNTWVPVQMLRS